MSWSQQQKEIFKFFQVGTGNCVIEARAGSGKCLAPDTLVLRYDGRTVRADAVKVGDELMGPDSKPKKVLGTTVGQGELYKVIPVRGESWICNDVHILTLVGTNHWNGQVRDVSVCDLLEESQKKGCQPDRNWKLFKPEGVDFPTVEEPLVDSYFLGLWFGDGTKETKPGRGLTHVAVSKSDPEVLATCKETAKKWNLSIRITDKDRCPTINLTSGSNKGQNRNNNFLLTAMQTLVGENLHIPDSVKFGSKDVRRQFLAGFLDSDGHLSTGCFDIVQKRKDYLDCIVFIARSLGISAEFAKTKIIKGVPYYRATLSGNVDSIPTKLPRKQAAPRKQVKNPLRTGFSLESIGVGEYAGFELDGDGRFLLGDFTVTHNTTTLMEGVTQAPEGKILIAAFNKAIERELTARLKKKGAHNVTAKTLHGLGYGILCKEIPGFKMDKDLPWKQRRSRKLSEASIVKVTKNARPGKDVITLVSKILDRARLSAPFATCGDELVDLAYAGGHLPNGFQQSNGWDINTLCECAHTALELAKDTTNLTHIDFNDMIFLPVVKGWGRPTYDMVCIDEAQDMTLVQLTLAQSVAKANARIVVVGDACQAIYGFRGADSKSLDRLRMALDAKSLSLTTTYRCATSIVEEAQRLVPDIQACDTAKEGKVDSIRMDNLPKEVKAGDFVLSRSNAPLMKTCLSFIREGIPAKIQGKEFGKQLASTIDIVSDKREGMATKEFMKLLATWRDEEVAKAIAAESEGRADSIADQAATIEVLSEGCEAVSDLYTKIDKLFGDPAKEHGFVVCSTVHKAKGLEADTVFMLIDTFYPGNPRGDRLVEEQNLEYVAITRAQNRLVRVS